MDLRVWQTLTEPKHEELVRQAMATDAKDVAAVARLRKVCADAEIVRAGLMLGEARRKAIPKFGKERAATLWADPAGVEMATSLVVAEHKQDHFFLYLPGWPLADVCCGIGGDAMALVEDNEVVAVDSDPVRAWMAGMNAGCKTVVGDAASVELPDGLMHIDPARRTERSGSRVWRLEDMHPGIDVVREIATRHAWGAAVKLGPGANLDEIAQVFPGSEIEIVSHSGKLMQCVVWIGMPMGPHSRYATLLRGSPDETREVRDARRQRLSGEPCREASLPVVREDRAARYVYEPDDSVERAELLGTLCEKVGAAMLHPRVGLLTSDTLIQSPWLTGFEVLEEMVWNERRVKDALDAKHAGIVEVKTRGGAVNTDQVQRSLRGKGDEPLVVFVLRMGSAVRGIVARRV